MPPIASAIGVRLSFGPTAAGLAATKFPSAAASVRDAANVDFSLSSLKTLGCESPSEHEGAENHSSAIIAASGRGSVAQIDKASLAIIQLLKDCI